VEDKMTEKKAEQRKSLKEVNKQFPKRNGFYFIGDKIYPSVTKIIDIFDNGKSGGISGAGIRDASKIALANPTLTEKEVRAMVFEGWRNKRNIPDVDKQPENIRGYLQGFKKWYDEEKPQFIHQEKTVHSDKYWYAGSLDINCLVRDVEGLVDVKTGFVDDYTTGMQLEAYKVGIIERGWGMPRKTWVLQLLPNATYKFYEVEGSFGSFLNLHEIYMNINKEDIEKVKSLNKEVK